MKRTGFKKPTLEEVKEKQRVKKERDKLKVKVVKKKSESISSLKKKLWTVFSLYIRQRDKFTCFTCGKKGEGSGMHAGHFIPKSVGGIALYFHEDNVHAQCYHCNINLGGSQYEYSLRLGKKAEELSKMKGIYTKWTVEDYKNKIEFYRKQNGN